MKIVKIFLLTFMLQPIFAQEVLLDSLFKELSFHNYEVSLENVIKNDSININFEAKKNFLITKPGNRDFDFVLFHVKTVRSLSVYGLISTDQIKNSHKNQIFDIGAVLIYDSNLKKIFFIEFDKVGLTIVFKNKKTISVSCNIHQYIWRIINLSDRLIPRGEIMFFDNAYTKYVIEDFNCEKFVVVLDNINYSNYQKITYKDLVDIFNTDFPEASKENCNTKDGFILYHFKL